MRRCMRREGEILFDEMTIMSGTPKTLRGESSIFYQYEPQPLLLVRPKS